MGNFYGNVTTIGPDRAAVVAALERLGRTALVAPTVDGKTVVFDEDEFETEKAAATISKALACVALGVNDHDDDVLSYGLYRDGALLDLYSSDADYGYLGPREKRTPHRGDAALLVESLGAKATPDSIRAILDAKYTLELHRHEALVPALGLPEFAVAAGFEYLSNGELPPGLEAADLTRVGDAEIEE